MPYNEQQGIWSGGQSSDPMVRALRGGALNRAERRKPMPIIPGREIPGRGQGYTRPTLPPGTGLPPKGYGGTYEPGKPPIPGLPAPAPNPGPLPPDMPGPKGFMTGGGATPMIDPRGGGGNIGAPAPQPYPMTTGGDQPPMPMVDPRGGGIMGGGPISAPVPLGRGMTYGQNPGTPFGGMPPRFGGPGNYRPPIDFGRTPPNTPSQGPVGQGPTGVPGGLGRLMFRR